MRRPRSITVIGWLFVATGCIGLAVALIRFLEPSGLPSALRARESGAHHGTDFALAAASGLVAAAGGALTLRGVRWARWIILAWMGAHVIIGILHSPLQLLVHGALFVALLFLLLRRSASEYFRRASSGGKAS